MIILQYFSEDMELINGGKFSEYPIEIVTNINDSSWYEIDEPKEIVQEESLNKEN